MKDITPMSRLAALLFEPSARLATPEDARRARLAAMINAALAFVALLGVVAWFIDPGRILAPVDALAVGPSAVVFLGAYWLARRGNYRLAAWVAIATISVGDFFVTFAGLRGLNPLYTPDDAAALTFLLVAVIIADVFLSRREVLALSTTYMVGMLAVPLAAPKVAWGPLVSGPIALIALAATLIVITTAHRDRLGREHSLRLTSEIDRRREMQAELSRHRDELEMLVEERTMGLEAVNAELREANEAKDRFMANMSHELRTPLNSIIGFTGVMKQGLAGPLTDEQSRQLGMVARSSRQLLGLVDQVLDLARIQAGQEAREPETFPLLALIRETAERIRPLAEAKGLQVRVLHDHVDESTSITTDRRKLARILNSLAGNAVKFTESGSVTLEVGLEDRRARLVVRDTGVGIPSGEIDAVFDEYRQVIGHDGAKPRGAGLGLSVSRRLANLLGGDIEVRSTAGSGSEFIVTIDAV